MPLKKRNRRRRHAPQVRQPVVRTIECAAIRILQALNVTPNEIAQHLDMTAPQAARVLLGLEPLKPAAIECLCRLPEFEWRTKFAAAVAACRASGADRPLSPGSNGARHASKCGCAQVAEVAVLPSKRADIHQDTRAHTPRRLENVVAG